MKVPYVGITDFTTSKETLVMLDVFENHVGYFSPRRLMVGVMMSYKTLHDLPSQWTSVFPKNKNIAGIFVDHPLAMNTLHYADYDGIDVLENLKQATRYGWPNMNAL